MPFVGTATDWRSPGNKWIRTDTGWRPLSDIHKALSAQIVNHFRHLKFSNSSRSVSKSSSLDLVTAQVTTTTSSSNKVSKSCSLAETQATQKQLASSSGNSARTNSNSLSQEGEQRLKQLYFLLSMKCVPVGRSSSRESNRYSTISDAISKMNFQQALQDENCFSFICEVLFLIFEGRYLSSSGSLQTTLLRITDRAKELAIRTRTHCHGGLVFKLVEKAIAANEELRRAQFTGYGVRNVDSKIKSLLKMKQQLRESQLQLHTMSSEASSCGATEMLHLPDDCLLHVVSYLYDPRDVLSVGLTNMRLYHVSRENGLWRKLSCFHYGHLDGAKSLEAAPQALTPITWMKIFIRNYKLCAGKLKNEPSCVVCVCKICNSVFWKSYGHPCCKSTSSNEGEPEGFESLTPQNFMQLFTC